MRDTEGHEHESRHTEGCKRSADDDGSAITSDLRSGDASDTRLRLFEYAFVTDDGAHVRLRLGVTQRFVGMPPSMGLGCADCRGRSTR